MLKLYQLRESDKNGPVGKPDLPLTSSPPRGAALIVTDPALPPECDDLRPRHPVQLGTRLPNSEAIAE